ncbi:hypothetical protein M758_UG150100 [Ceratodon purpureus]|nr:hypothetical protein M758_UG150100 [Ceratodon purpureus]
MFSALQGFASLTSLCIWHMFFFAIVDVIHGVSSISRSSHMWQQMISATREKFQPDI